MFSSTAPPSYLHNETGHLIETERCRDLSAMAKSIDSWISISETHSARDLLSLSELLDMSFVELNTIADLSIDKTMSLINRTLQEIITNVPDSGLLACWKKILPNAGFDFSIREETILTIIANCCNQLRIQERDRTQTTIPDSAVSKEMAKYTIPDAYNLYKSRTWMISLISFHRFQGELHNNQRLALLELLFFYQAICS